jgi:predicted alpha-1,2-mannosidase
MKLLLAKSNAGRILLHLLCVCRGGDRRFHWAGVSREFKSACKNARSLFPLLTVATIFHASPGAAQVDFVDTKIGNVGILLEPTRPTVSIPNSMVRVYPVRKDGLDDQIQSFPLTIISHRLGELFWIMPNAGAPTAAAWNQRATYDQETSTPYFYSVRFDDSLITTEFTPTARCGYFRFTFPSGKPVVLLANRTGGNLSAAESNSLSGTENFNGMRAFVYGEFSAPVTFAHSQSGEKERVTATANAEGKTLEFRYGISFISVEQAKKNLREGIASWNFDKTKANARAAWEKALGQIQVEGGTPDQKRVFYTALYRCYERMVNISEDGQYYSAFDHKVHQDARPFYVDNWLWDTYRALEPLQTLLNPEMEADKVQSYVRMYEQLGWLPCFAVLWGNHECMTGNHAAPWMADVWAKGITNFDLTTAYEGLRKNSLDGTWLPWRKGPKCSLDDFLDEHGYMPALKPEEKETVSRVHPFERRQAVSVTLAQSYDDWCTAQIARTLNHQPDYQLFLKRAADYKNVFRADKGHVWPKDADGNWIEAYEPGFSGGQGGRDYTTENNGYTYDWDVQHDLNGLFTLMGGREQAEAKLDRLFRESLGRSKYEFWAKFPDASGLVGQFSMGNEPSLHIPYLYNHLGAPWKTQKRVRQLLEYMFPDSPNGIPGDEDGGGLSAFVVFSMMGFYPTEAGVPTYEMGSPVFEKVTIHLHNGKTFRIVASGTSENAKYIQALRLNGKAQDRVWFRHADIINGLTIQAQMSETPNTTLGTKEDELPPSSMTLDPRMFEVSDLK